MSGLSRWEKRNLKEVRFFADENFAAFGRALMHLRRDVVTAKTPPITEESGIIPHYDDEWIPVVAQRGWVVLTNDKHIRTRPEEAQQAVEHGLRCVCLLGPDGTTPWDFMRLLTRHWERVEEVTQADGPLWLTLRIGHPPKEQQYRPGAPPRVPPA